MMLKQAFLFGALVLTTAASAHAGDEAESLGGGQPTLRVQGRRLVNGAGQAVQLRGVNRAIFESRCAYDGGRNYADGPAGQASVTAMRSWKIDVVRVTVNEDCWLGINGLPLSGDAAGYRKEVIDYIRLLRGNRLYVIAEAHVTAPGTNRSTRIDNMPDKDHLPAFWRSMSARLKTDHGIIFDVINEVAMGRTNDPHPMPPGKWRCWRDGCELDSMYGGRFQAAGLQSLVHAIGDKARPSPSCSAASTTTATSAGCSTFCRVTHTIS